MEIIVFRMIQAVGASFLFANSAALITDAFPEKELGRAMGINQIAGLAGTFIGLVVGGTLATIYWRDVFLVSVPVGVVGAVWSYWKLKEIGVVSRGQKIDVWGNVTFAVGLTILLISLTYGLLPYGASPMGWTNPFVVAGLLTGASFLCASLSSRAGSSIRCSSSAYSGFEPSRLGHSRRSSPPRRGAAS